MLKSKQKKVMFRNSKGFYRSNTSKEAINNNTKLENYDQEVLEDGRIDINRAEQENKG